MSLFRPEVLAERRSEQWGSAVASSAPRLVLASLALVLVGLLGMAAVLGLDYARKIRVAGYLEPEGGIAEVTAAQGGRVAALKVSEQDQVTQGQVLAVLDHDHFSEQGRQVHLEEAAYLRASLERLERRMRTAEDKRASDLEAVREELAHLALERDALVEELRFAEQREALRQAAEERARKLLADGLLATANYDQERQATLTVAQAASQLRRALAGNQRQSAQARQALVRLEREHQTQRLQLQQERADLARQLVRLGEQRQTAVVAPRDGVVTFAQFAVGDRVRAEQVLMTLAPVDAATQLVLLADAAAAADIAPGDEVRFKALSGQRRRNPIGAAVVREVSQAPQKPYQLRSWVAVDGPVFRARAEVLRHPEGSGREGRPAGGGLRGHRGAPAVALAAGAADRRRGGFVGAQSRVAPQSAGNDAG